MNKTVAWLFAVAAAAAASTVWVAERAPAWGKLLAAQGIELAAPQWLWLAAVAWVVPLALPWRLTDLPRWQAGLQVAVRMALLALLAVALAHPRVPSQRPRMPQVIHLVDRSDSVPDALLAAAREQIAATAAALRDLANKQPADPELPPPAAPCAVVAFDARAERLPMDCTAETIQVPPMPRRAGRDRDEGGRATDLQAGLNMALGLIDGHTVPHVVIWSDGLQTQGEALQAVDALRRAGVRVDVPRLPPLPPEPEMLVDRFELPQTIRAGVKFPLAVHVQANEAGAVTCQVRAADNAVAPVRADVRKGETRVALGELVLRHPGAVDLQVDCTPAAGRDRFASNNRLSGRVIVRDRPKILYVEGQGARGAVALTKALLDDFEVDVRPGDGLPRSLGGLLPYQAILLSDVPTVSRDGVPLLTDGDMRNLEAYVQRGGGLVVLGGENSLGSGGYQDTYLDKHVLPVAMDVESKVEQPTIGMMLAIDRSGSMKGPKMELAKAAAIATAQALARDDLIGVVAFDSEARLAVRLQRAGNSYRIESDIAKLSAEGGTHIYPALDLAYQQLVPARAKVKHVIVMTDGVAPRSGIDALVRQMRNSGITVSAVGVGSDVDRNLLEAIADRGGGRSYFTDRPETLPRIFVRETKLIGGQSVIETAVRARVAPGVQRVDLLRGVDIGTAPALTGFLPAKVKPKGEEILRLSNGKPLLVRWRLGMGKVSVWTSDLKNRWAANWAEWPGYARLARQIVRDALQEDLGIEVQVRLVRERDRLRVAVDAVDDDGSPLKGLVGEAAVRDPGGALHKLPMREVADGRYEAGVPLQGYGAWDVQVSLRAAADKPILASGRATAIHPYPDEHRIAADNEGVLAALAAATGGKIDSQPADWLGTGGQTHTSYRALWPDLLQTALLLLLIDVLLRRVRLGKAPVVRWHGLRKLK